MTPLSPELDLVLSRDHSTARERCTAITPLFILEFIYCFLFQASKDQGLGAMIILLQCFVLWNNFYSLFHTRPFFVFVQWLGDTDMLP